VNIISIFKGIKCKRKTNKTNNKGNDILGGSETAITRWYPARCGENFSVKFWIKFIWLNRTVHDFKVDKRGIIPSECSISALIIIQCRLSDSFCHQNRAMACPCLLYSIVKNGRWDPSMLAMSDDRKIHKGLRKLVINNLSILHSIFYYYIAVDANPK
jgi:hypothetical protein